MRPTVFSLFLLHFRGLFLAHCSHCTQTSVSRPAQVSVLEPTPHGVHYQPTISSYSGSPFPASVQDPGLHIWRVEKLKPVPIARENHGIFFSGDSYLVLHNGPEEASHLHLWIGKGVGMGSARVWPRRGMEVTVGLRDLACPPTFILGQQSSRDEQGACAVLAVHLNTLLGERPVQHREVQGNESDLFMSYFPRGLKYQVRTTSRPSFPGLFSGSVPASGCSYPSEGLGALGDRLPPPFIS